MSTEIMKKNLDIFLTKIPDQPVMGDYKPATCNPRGSPSNSLLEWIPAVTKDLRRPKDARLQSVCDEDLRRTKGL